MNALSPKTVNKNKLNIPSNSYIHIYKANQFTRTRILWGILLSFTIHTHIQMLFSI